MSKWYTFAPEAFGANTNFFERDSGIYCRTLQKMGYESKVIMLGPAPSPDTPDVVRGSREQLASSAWWQALGLDGVIMVAWARHRDTPIVRAIAASGTPLVLCIDGSGSCYPIIHFSAFLKGLWQAERGTHRSLVTRTAHFFINLINQGSRRLLKSTYLKYRHLKYASLVCLQTPTSLEQHNQLCTLFGGKNHPIRFLMTGYPVNPVYQRDPKIPKEKRIITIGRWDDLRQKRPYILMEVCEKIARLQPELQIDIFGGTTPPLHQWHDQLESTVRERIHLLGYQPASTILLSMQKAQVCFMPSSYESFCMAMFEGLACGATPVGLASVDFPGILWAASQGHGDAVPEDTIDAYVATLQRALQKWADGYYDPEKISAFWSAQNNASNILTHIFETLPPKGK